MSALAWVLVTLAGALSAAQSGGNAQLVRCIGRPWLSALLVSLVTTCVFLAAFLLTGARLPQAGQAAAVPWWAWTGGLCGAAYVASTLFFAQRLGAGLFTGLTITAGIAASVALDHFGLLGFARHAAGPARLLGAALMVAGVILVARS